MHWVHVRTIKILENIYINPFLFSMGKKETKCTEEKYEKG